jgi:hypothetical protein
MNQDILQQKLTTLISFPEINSDMAQKVGQILATANEWDLLRINPLRFANAHHFDPLELIDLFVHGAKIGLFDLNWNVICPGCGSIEHHHTSINDLQGQTFHCTICHVDIPTQLDDQVEVSFTINPSIHKITINPFQTLENYHRYFFSANFQRSQPHQAYLNDVRRSFTRFNPGASQAIRFEAQAGQSYRLLSLDLHSVLFIAIDAAGQASA